MYVLNVMNTGTGAAATGGLSLLAGASYNFPADRCVWTVSDSSDDRGYRVVGAFFYDGASASLTTGEAAPAALHGTNLIIRFGYIGKSGRFVPVTDRS